MLNDESDWRRGQRRNRIGIGVAVLASVAALVWPELHGLRQDTVIGASAGLFGALLAFEFWLYRRPKGPAPDPDEIERIDRRDLLISLVSTLATWTFLACLLLVTTLELAAAWNRGLMVAGGVSLVLALICLPALLQHMRLSRIAPQLNDERRQRNMDRAFRQGFLLMFQCAFVAGMLLTWEVIVLPAELVAFGLGIIGILAVSLLSIRYEWRDR